MILLYLLLVAALGVVGFVVNRRAAAARSRHDDAADDHKHALAMAQAPTKEYSDHMARQMVLMDAHKDHKAAMARHDKWSGRAESVNRLRQSLRGWRGRKAPYLLGVLDSLGLLGLVDLLGLHGRVGEMVVTFVKTLFTTAAG